MQPFPATGVKYQLSSSGLENPHELAWSPDGKELLYVPKIFGFEAVTVTTQPTFAFGNAVAVPRPFRVSAPNARTPFDMMPDGRFLGFVVPGQGDVAAVPGAPRQIQVVLNWSEDLKARVP